MDQYGRERVWSLYGWFCGLMLCGSCFGAVSWLAWMQCLVNLFSGNDPSSGDAQRSLLNSVAYAWRAAFTVTYPVEFLCLSCSKLMVLDRMVDFVMMQSVKTLKKWNLWRWMIISVVSLGNLVGLSANAAAAVQYQEASAHFSESSSHYVANNTVEGRRLFVEGRLRHQSAAGIASIQYVSEASVLLFIVAAFPITAAACARRIRSTFAFAGRCRSLTAVQSAGRKLLMQILLTAGVVFAAFLLRTIYSAMQAAAYLLQNTGTNCNSSNFCDACYNV
jgi:hypothetical protein